jgi:hypothetical protein
MFYISYIARTINILKCARCRSYDITLDTSASPSHYECSSCGNTGDVKLSGKVNLESFGTWEELEQRIEELKSILSLSPLERL